MSAPAIKPVTEIKRRATEIIAQLKADRVPVLLEGIARGERAFSDGRVVSHAEAKKRLLRGDRLF
jgi:hypothetical protein